MQAEKFKNLIRQILAEEIENQSAVGVTSYTRAPEMNANGIDAKKKDGKRFSTDSNTRDVKGKEALLADLIEATRGIDDSISVVWDDHDDLMVSARDLKYIRISPRWEDYYVIEMFTRNEDRVWVTGLDWFQVKEFVKTNLKNLKSQPTAVEKAYDKSYRNREDNVSSPDKGLPQKDKPKIKPLTTEPPNTSKNREKAYTEPQVKNEEDLPNKPMREMTDLKKLSDYKVKDPVKLRKRKPDTKLINKF